MSSASSQEMPGELAEPWARRCVRRRIARPFCRGWIPNDVTKVASDRAIGVGFLTAQGRFLHDFFVHAIGDTLYLDCEAARLDDLRKRLLLYRLRAL